ncbi:YIP1 family protein [Thermodesulfobacteriota bacterium]
MNRFIDRILRAAKLDAHLYEEVEADRSAMSQAMAVVVISSVAAGIGSIGMGVGGPGGFLFGIIASLGGWYLWAYLIFFIGTKVLPEPQTHSDPGELLRTIGFSSSPGFIRVLGIIPGLGALVFSLASVWMLVAMVVAVRQALDYKSTWRAVGVCAIGWVIQMVIFMILFSFFGGGTPPAG